CGRWCPTGWTAGATRWTWWPAWHERHGGAADGGGRVRGGGFLGRGLAAGAGVRATGRAVHAELGRRRQWPLPRRRGPPRRRRRLRAAGHPLPLPRLLEG